METLIKADIFFFLSSVATVVLAILASILLFYLIRAGRTLYILSESLKGHYKDSEDFVVELKERLEENIVFRLFFPPARRRKKEPVKDEQV
jgi:hypothetical protein